MSIHCSSASPPQSRQYSLSLSPSIVPSVGPLISSLVSSGVARHTDFRLLERVGIYHPSGQVGLVPSSKEDVFKNKNLSLVEKRRLMRFLIFAAGEFEESNEITGKESQPLIDFLRQTFLLNEEMAQVITFSVAFCMSSSGQTPLCVYFYFFRYLSLSRTDPSGPSPPPTVPAIRRSVWCFAIPRQSLRWIRRTLTMVLSNLCCSRWHLYSWSKNYFHNFLR
jgi:hypothetical protein